MKEFIFLRYANQPNPTVSQKLAEFIKPGTQIPFTTLPGVLITMFKSDNTHEEILTGMGSLNIKFDLIEKEGTVTPIAQTSPLSNRSGASEPVTVASLQRKLDAALAAEDFELASTLRDEIAALTPPAPDAPTAESKLYTSIDAFKESLLIKESELGQEQESEPVKIKFDGNHITPEMLQSLTKEEADNFGDYDLNAYTMYLTAAILIGGNNKGIDCQTIFEKNDGTKLFYISTYNYDLEENIKSFIPRDIEVYVFMKASGEYYVQIFETSSIGYSNGNEMTVTNELYDEYQEFEENYGEVLQTPGADINLSDMVSELDTIYNNAGSKNKIDFPTEQFV